MKKIVRLTESDITRIVKRVMNEAKGPLLLGDPDDSYDDDRDSDGDDNLSDKEFYMKYAGSEDLGWDVPHNKRRNRLRDIKGNYKKRKGNGMNEALGLLDRKKYSDLPGGIVKRKITDYASAKRYTMGTKVSADLIMRLIERGGSVFMYTDRSSDKIFIDTLSKGVYDQLDRRIGEVTGNMDDWAMDYFDDSMNESLYESYDYPKRKSIGTIKGRKLTLDNFSKYIMGTKISAKTIESYLEDGDDIIMYSNGPKRVFLNYTNGKAYNEKDRLITIIKRKESFDELEDYLES